MEERPPTDLILVGVIMGSKSDWDTMRHAAEILENFGVPYEKKIVSAHRTPDQTLAYASAAEGRGIKVLIAGAGGGRFPPGRGATKSWPINVPVTPLTTSNRRSFFMLD